MDDRHGDHRDLHTELLRLVVESREKILCPVVVRLSGAANENDHKRFSRNAIHSIPHLIPQGNPQPTQQLIAAFEAMHAVDAPELMHVYADKGDWAEELIPKVVLDPFRETHQTPAPGQEIDLSELRLRILFHRFLFFRKIFSRYDD